MQRSQKKLKEFKPDHLDEIIMAALVENPKISQEEIAKKVNMSQPSVWARIKNLEQRKIIKFAVIVSDNGGTKQKS